MHSRTSTLNLDVEKYSPELDVTVEKGYYFILFFQNDYVHTVRTAKLCLNKQREWHIANFAFQKYLLKPFTDITIFAYTWKEQHDFTKSYVKT